MITGTALDFARQSPPQSAPRGSYDLEILLRDFRAKELRNRNHPGLAGIACDAVPRMAVGVAGYVGMLLFDRPLLYLAIVLFSVGTTTMLGSWFHDVVHKNVRAPGWLLFILLRFGSAPVGFSPRWWRYKHVKLHHRYPGDPRFDPDIQFGRLGRVSARQPWHRSHRLQHVYMWFFLPLVSLNMLKPAELWLPRRYDRLLNTRSRLPVALLLVDKYLPFLLVWAPVLAVRGPRLFLIAFTIFHLTTGTLIAVITQVQHNTELSDLGTGEDLAGLPLCEQVFRTTDVADPTGIWSWLCGGVNYHVAHHLAPTLTFLELPAVTARLTDELRRAGVVLPTHPGLFAAIRSHAALIRSLARRPVPARI